jgi:type II secretory pathway pseudopilin PulG
LLRKKIKPWPTMTDARDNFSRRVFFGVGGGLSLLVLGLAVAVIVWRMRLGKEVNARLSALQAAGYPTSGAELNAWYASVPDNENAGLNLGDAFAVMRKYPDKRAAEIDRFKPPPRGEALTAPQRELLAGHVALNAEALAQAREAITLPRSRYPVDLSPGIDALLPHLTKIKSLAQTANFEARLAVDAGRSGDVLTGISTVLGLARTLDEEPLLVSQLVRVAVVNMSVASLERSLAADAFNDTELSHLSIAFAGAERTNLMARALIGDRAMTIPVFRVTFFARLTCMFERDLNFYLRYMETNIALASRPPPWGLAITNLADQGVAADRKRYLISGLVLPALSRSMGREIESLARLRLAQAALAIERFRLANGRLPKELNELIPSFLPVVPTDPFDGAQLRYKQRPKGYVVYSVGADGRDDDGTEAPTGPSRNASAPQDITIAVER